MSSGVLTVRGLALKFQRRAERLVLRRVAIDEDRLDIAVDDRLPPRGIGGIGIGRAVVFEPERLVHFAKPRVRQTVDQGCAIRDVALQHAAHQGLAEDLIFEVERPHDEIVDFAVLDKLFDRRYICDLHAKGLDAPRVLRSVAHESHLPILRRVDDLERQRRGNPAERDHGDADVR
jgi:hypothetical protein